MLSIKSVMAIVSSSQNNHQLHDRTDYTDYYILLAEYITTS